MKDDNRTQKELLRVFKVFKSICEEHNLKYFAIGGTCIGAVRHHGFIPWDDDIDVAMPYEDYKRLQEISNIPFPYELYLPSEHEHWEYNFMKLHDGSTTFVEENCKQFKDRYLGIYIDIMPIYGLPKNRVKQKIVLELYDLLITLNRRMRREPTEQHGFKKVFWYIGKPFGVLFNYDVFLKIIDNMLGKYPFNNSDKVLFGWRQKKRALRKNNTYGYVFYLEDFSKCQMTTFEDTTISIPFGYDRYLKMDFPGDYMVLPPEENRISRHKYDIYDLNKSYKEYLKENEKILI